jgi:protein SCO1
MPYILTRFLPSSAPARRAVLVAAALAAVAAGIAVYAAVSGSGSSPAAQGFPRPSGTRFMGAPIPDGAVVPGFALHDQDGQLVRLSSEKGKLVLVTFLYTRCHDICPVIAAQLDHAARAFGKSSGKVEVLAVSVDPKGDTRSAVKRYVRVHQLGPEFRWLIGTANQLAPVWHAYNIQVANRSSDEVAHTAPVYLIDQKGRPRVYYAPPPSPQAIVHDVRLLLNA